MAEIKFNHIFYFEKLKKLQKSKLPAIQIIIVNQLENEKRRRAKNYFCKEAEGEHSRLSMPTDGNMAKRIFSHRTYLFLS